MTLTEGQQEAGEDLCKEMHPSWLGPLVKIITDSPSKLSACYKHLSSESKKNLQSFKSQYL